MSKKVSLLLSLALCLVLPPCTLRLRRQRPVLPEPVPENSIIRTIWVDEQALGFEQPADSTLEQIDALLSALGLEAGTPYDDARVSTQDQNLDLQKDALSQEGCGRIFTGRVARCTCPQPPGRASEGYG